MVQGAKTSIFATMDLAEELARPLPEEYFSLLAKKNKEGVRLQRVAFGTPEGFQEFLKLHPDQASYSLLTASRDYRRMLLVDDIVLMYAVDVKGSIKFFQTSSLTVVKEFKGYFKRLIEGVN